MADSKPASSESISISQAVLAPLDAIFKAQIHAARSYLNMLGQMAYPHADLDENDNIRQDTPVEDKKPYTFPVNFEVMDGETKRVATVNIPTIAMVPVTPLGIEEATIKFSMSVTEITQHEQLQESTKTNPAGATDWSKTKRPWYLVSDPVSMKGNIVTSDSSKSSLEISIKITKSPMPSALEKALTILTQNISVTKS
jgi:hypothetical protein